VEPVADLRTSDTGESEVPEIELRDMQHPAGIMRRADNRRRAQAGAARACPSCGWTPESVSRLGRLREDLAVDWLHADSRRAGRRRGAPPLQPMPTSPVLFGRLRPVRRRADARGFPHRMPGLHRPPAGRRPSTARSAPGTNRKPIL
jgi:hypothetical protein